jgi:hypothetical protein
VIPYWKHSAAVLSLLSFALLVYAQPQEDSDFVRVLTDSVNMRAGYRSDITEVLGEVSNETGFIIGSVLVTITLKDRSGKILDTDFTYVKGKTVDVGYVTDTGIFPGERAPFKESLSAVIDSVNSVEYIVTYKVAEPRTDLSDTPLLLQISRTDSLSLENQTQIQLLKSRVDSLTSDSGDNTSSSLLGDLDNDGDVDFSDFLTFAQNFGKTV